MTKPIRIMIVDDHAVIRSGLRMLIEHDQSMTVVGMAGTAAEALRVAEAERPDVIVLDLVLAEEDGLDFLPDLCKVSPNSRVLVLTGLQTPDSHRTAIRRGAVGVVLKQQAAELLLKAISKVHAGEVWIDRSMMGSVLTDARSEAREEINPEALKIKSLTPRELEVVGLVSEGLKNRQIGERLFISETTVTHHLSSIYSKLGVSDRLELVIYAFANELAKKP
ncbi:MAG TPA: response regulator transcription factor [Pyrinomonadaceae bacterium]|nr:response regulator transcription factor [Pyrinomonadaceae bacterium]